MNRRSLAEFTIEEGWSLLPHRFAVVANAFVVSLAVIENAGADYFTNTGSMTEPRGVHTATLLANGEVLVAGAGLYYSFSSAELYDPTTGKWARTGAMSNGRAWHTATLLPNRKVLVAGGVKSGVAYDTELYDPATGTWTRTGRMTADRTYHTATLLPNGKVLVAGGWGYNLGSLGPLSSTELYDSTAGTWTETGALTTARQEHTATLLPNGKVLVTGGSDFATNGYVSLSSAELYDPATGTWTATVAMSAKRSGHTATLLPNGNVLIAGGVYPATAAELYVPDIGAGTGNGTPINIRIAQRLSTTLVDLFYDLSGNASSYSVSVAVSSDGGATFAIPATHFSGDGVTSPVASGAGRHIVWDAGADLPGQFSTKMRFKVMVGSAFALSPIFTLDTRTVPTGTLTGLVHGNGAPVANAQVRIDNTTFAASTGADGRFTLANVPAGSGYLLKVSAAGFASKSVPGILVTSGTKDLGTIQLATLGGPYRLVPLQPDVNPPVTQIEDGGVGYRYYRLIPVNANDNPGGVTVTLRIAGGATVPQDGGPPNDWQGYQSAYWPGYQAGAADGDGVVRLRIPAGAIGGPGASATLGSRRVRHGQADVHRAGRGAAVRPGVEAKTGRRVKRGSIARRGRGHGCRERGPAWRRRRRGGGRNDYAPADGGWKRWRWR